VQRFSEKIMLKRDSDSTQSHRALAGSERAVPDRPSMNRDCPTTAVFDAGANRATKERGAQERQQRGNKTAKHDRSAHHPETDR